MFKLKQIKQVFKLCFFALLCNFIPVKKNKIVFSCHGGKGSINCNPKYICLEILKQKLPYEIIWITDKKNDINDEHFNDVRIIDNKNTFQKMLTLMSAKIWIENSLKVSDYQKGLFKKKKQIYINTWHGSFGIKKMFYDIKKFNDKTIWAKFFKKEISQIDYMFASSPWEESIYESGLKYKGAIFRIGNSRNDLFFKNKDEIKKKVFEYFKISENKKVLLCAPTFRDGREIEIDINFSKLKEVLKEKFDEEFIIFSRMHIEQRNKINNKNVIDVSCYPDVQELLVASDILISDYSSIMFDFMLLKKPCFVYAPDVDKFSCERGLSYPLEETPFLIAKNNDELFQNILKFDCEKYQKECSDFVESKKVLNDGLASIRAVEFIEKILKN